MGTNPVCMDDNIALTRKGNKYSSYIFFQEQKSFLNHLYYESNCHHVLNFGKSFVKYFYTHPSPGNVGSIHTLTQIMTLQFKLIAILIYKYNDSLCYC